MNQLLLLHGALGSKEQFSHLVPKLEGYYELHLLNFEGHGQSGPTDSPFRIEYFTENVLGYLDEHGIDKINIFGYSMGGYVALALAQQYPERVHKIATLGTILQWDEETAARECRLLYPEKIQEKVPHFAERLNNRHIHGWERVVNSTREMLEDLGYDPVIKQEDWKTFDHPIRLHVGDRDTTAGLEETISVYRKVDKAGLTVLPQSGHPIQEVNESVFVTSLLNFL